MNLLNAISTVSHRFQGLSEASELADLLSQSVPNQSMVRLGLTEIFINAIEHGNLGIDYTQRPKQTHESQWLYEINKRLADEKYKNKYITVTIEKTPHYTKFTVTDQGSGFDWQKYQNLTTVPLTESRGRGILIAKEVAFDQLIYHPPGNQVDCIILHKE